MSVDPFNIVMIQEAPCVGDIPYNLEKILQAIQKARQAGAHLVVFSELALTGYPPEDLLLRSSYPEQVKNALQRIAHAAVETDVLVGAPDYQTAGCYNAVFHCHSGKIADVIHKRALPNYGVFDEKRYFIPGQNPGCIEVFNYRIGILICEDAWQSKTVSATMALQPDLFIQINASPFEVDKQHYRYQLIQKIIEQHKLPCLVLNRTGAQDELLFEGASFVMDQQGHLVQQAPFFEKAFIQQTLHRSSSGLALTPGPLHQLPSIEAQVYQGLMMGLRAYLESSQFKRIVIGLSGGIDSALTLAIAADALGPESVTAVMMPSRYTAAISIEDARTQARHLGVHYLELPIESSIQALQETLFQGIAEPLSDLSTQNLQARTRGLLLMALANQYQALLLGTSNKSELAVGYTTLYGDMNGAYSVLKDVYKTQVYALALYRNALTPIIPLRVLTRAPTAELKANQTDQDTLPPYDELDAILKGLIEYRLDAAPLIEDGFSPATVHWVIKQLWQSEYKRRQAPPGPKISSCSFGRDWRMPLMKG